MFRSESMYVCMYVNRIASLKAFFRFLSLIALSHVYVCMYVRMLEASHYCSLIEVFRLLCVYACVCPVTFDLIDISVSSCIYVFMFVQFVFLFIALIEAESRFWLNSNSASFCMYVCMLSVLLD